MPELSPRARAESQVAVLQYVARRCYQAVIVLFLVSVVVFALLHVLPGGLVRAQLGPRASHAEVLHLTHQEGLTKPFPVQYLLYLRGLLHGTLGFAYTRQTAVSTLVGEYFPRELLLYGLSLVLSVLLAVPLGMLQAARRNTLTDYGVSGGLLTAYSMPVFLVGFVLIVIFSLDFHLLPATATNFGKSVGTDARILILPVAAITIGNVSYFGRFVRSSVIDNLGEDYVRTARAKGAGRSRILFRHVLRSSLLPLVSVVGMSLPTVVGGALMIEYLFHYPGMGTLYWDAQQARTYPLLIGIILVLTLAVVVGNLLADIAYGLLDPRVRYG